MVKVTLHVCAKCTYSATRRSSLKSHLAHKHGIGAVWLTCPEAGCTYRTLQCGHLKEHLAAKHGTGGVWLTCPEAGCTHRTLRRSNLKMHLAHKHGIGAIWLTCPEAGCTHRTLQRGHLKLHLAAKHGIGGLTCPEAGCTHRTLRRSDLKKHLAHKHGTGVVWLPCTHAGCTSKFKSRGHLNAHLAHKHDIGDHQCEYCLGHHTSKIPYTDKNMGRVHICRKCYNRVTGKTSRVELTWSNYTDTALGVDFLIGNDTSLRTLGGCSRRRPDKMYASPGHIEIDECDEHQHRYHGSTAYTCEEARLTEIYDDPSLCGSTMTVIRWNPDTYTVPPGSRRVPRKERLAMFVALKQHLRRSRSEQDPRIRIFYMFYDRDNPTICQNLPRVFIDTWSDIYEA